MQMSALKEKSFSFALRIAKLYGKLPPEAKAFPLTQQLLEGGTRIGALIRRVTHAQTDANFVQCLFEAEEKCNEVLFFLELLQETAHFSLLEEQLLAADAEALLKEIEARIKLIETKNNN